MTGLAGHVHDLSGLSALDWVIVGGAALFVAGVLWHAVRLTLRPGEDDPDHIKRQILEDGPAQPRHDEPDGARERGGPPAVGAPGP